MEEETNTKGEGDRGETGGKKGRGEEESCLVLSCLLFFFFSFFFFFRLFLLLFRGLGTQQQQQDKKKKKKNLKLNAWKMGINLDECIERVQRRELLGSEVVREMCTKLKEVLVNESNVAHISAPVTVVGDVHGQFYDVIELFNVGGFVPSTNYLFLGDYVDRGHHSVETISLLCLLKLRYPDRVNLIRGNHESRAVTQVREPFDPFALCPVP